MIAGATSGLGALGSAVAIVLVPSLVAQLAASRSSMTVLDAVLIALNLLVVGHGGGTVLSTGVIDGVLTLTPLGLTLVFVALCAAGMLRTGRRLQLVGDTGGLRPRGLRDAGAALGAAVVVYAGGLGVLAELGRGQLMDPVATSAVVSGALVAVLGGLSGLALSIRREERDGVPAVRILDLFPRPWDAVARSAAIALLGLAALGMLALMTMVVLRFGNIASLFTQLEAGLWGGLVLTLLQLAMLPLLALWALTVLLGGSVTLGTGTGLDLGGFDTGVMPLFPLLGALPDPGAAPPALRALMVLPAAIVALGAVQLVRDLEGEELRDRITAYVAYPVVVMLGVVLLAGLSTGSIGQGRLVHLGPQVQDLLLPLLIVVVASTGLVLGVLATGLVELVQDGTARLRERIEAAEAKEGADVSESAPAAAPAEDDADGETEPPGDRTEGGGGRFARLVSRMGLKGRGVPEASQESAETDAPSEDEPEEESEDDDPADADADADAVPVSTEDDGADDDADVWTNDRSR